MLYIIDTTAGIVVLTIPTASVLPEGALSLVLRTDITKSAYTLLAQNVTSTPYSVTAKFTVTSLPSGQYTYSLMCGTSEIGRGVLQVGLSATTPVEYKNEQDIIVYNG